MAEASLGRSEAFAVAGVVAICLPIDDLEDGEWNRKTVSSAAEALGLGAGQALALARDARPGPGGGGDVTFDARQRPHLVLSAAGGVPGASPSGDPIALITGLKMYTTDPAGQAGQDWERHCHDTGQPGCDLSTTLLQPLGDAAPKIS